MQEFALAPGSEGVAMEAALTTFFQSLVQCLAQLPASSEIIRSLGSTGAWLRGRGSSLARGCMLSVFVGGCFGNSATLPGLLCGAVQIDWLE